MNKLSTQVVAFLVLAVVTLVGALIVTNSDIDTTVKTANASLLDLTANDSAIDFTIGYPEEWQMAPNTDGTGYIFTLKDSLEGVAAEAQPQIAISLVNSPYADTLASAESGLGVESLDAYETIDSHRSGVRYSTTDPLDNGQQVTKDIVVLNPVDVSVTSEYEENRTVIAQLTADANKAGEYRQILDLMLTSLSLKEPFRVPELAQSLNNPSTGMTINYPNGWSAAISSQDASTIQVIPENANDGLMNIIYVPLIDPSTGAPITLADLENLNLSSSSISITEPLALYSAGGYTGDAGVISITNPNTGQASVLYIVFLQLSPTDAVIALARPDANNLDEMRQSLDAILRTIQYTPPTESATPEAEETATAEPTTEPTEVPTEAVEAPTEVPTEVPTAEATPVN